MKEFALIFRTKDNGTKPSPEQLQQLLSNWTNWMGSIAAQNRLADKGTRLGIQESKVVKPGNVITDGPYTEIKEFINGFIIVKAENADDAAQIAKGCPILNNGGNVEVRPLVTPDNNS